MDKKDRLAQPEQKGKEQIIYDILCSDEQPPEGQHWEGFVASKIAAALAQPEQEQTRSQKMRDAGITRRLKRWDKNGDDTEQEPVAWVRWDDEESYWDVRRNPPSDEAVQYLKSIKRPPWVPAYPHPPQREWQGLTDEEIREFEIWLDDEEEKHGWNPPADIVKYIEAKLKEKNNG